MLYIINLTYLGSIIFTLISRFLICEEGQIYIICSPLNTRQTATYLLMILQQLKSKFIVSFFPTLSFISPKNLSVVKVYVFLHGHRSRLLALILSFNLQSKGFGKEEPVFCFLVNLWSFSPTQKKKKVSVCILAQVLL